MASLLRRERKGGCGDLIRWPEMGMFAERGKQGWRKNLTLEFFLAHERVLTVKAPVLSREATEFDKWYCLPMMALESTLFWDSPCQCPKQMETHPLPHLQLLLWSERMAGICCYHGRLWLPSMRVLKWLLWSKKCPRYASLSELTSLNPWTW